MTDFHISERDEHARYPVLLGDKPAGWLIEDPQSGCLTMLTGHPRLPRMDGRKFRSKHKAMSAIKAVLNCEHKWIEGSSLVTGEQTRLCQNCGLYESCNALDSGKWEPEWMPDY